MRVAHHPLRNPVRTRAVDARRARREGGAGSPDVTPAEVLSVVCEIRLVQEYASMGTLRECIGNGALCQGGDPDVRFFGLKLT